MKVFQHHDQELISQLYNSRIIIFHLSLTLAWLNVQDSILFVSDMIIVKLLMVSNSCSVYVDTDNK